MKDSVVAMVRSCSNSAFDRPLMMELSRKRRLLHIFTVSLSGMLVNKESTSKLLINIFVSCLLMSFAKLNESFAVYWFVVNGFSSLFIYCDSLYVGELMAERIGRNLGMLLTRDLWTFDKQYNTLGCDPVGLSSP